MNKEYQYRNFVNSEHFTLFKWIITDQIKDYFDKLSGSQNKEEVWELKQSIETLNRLVAVIETISKETEVNPNQ